MVGGVMSGYCDTGREYSPTNPARVMMTDSTLAKIGRSMKKRVNIASQETEDRGQRTAGWSFLPAARSDLSESVIHTHDGRLEQRAEERERDDVERIRTRQLHP